ncbi:toll/interleukin-1 receptor domain-containing protein, partial [Ilumatobacter sp.]|uniref:toll/interleukin-1 receptor domain-containing protein n=1 Tax=Ilumatobacter sp. TaxID=1967498 RepID=UPI003AF99971
MARGGVFVSYRRSDALSAAHHVHSELARVLRDLDGDDQRKVFLDIDAIQPGEDFRDVINDTLQLCIAVLVVIGPRWLSTADSRGRRRLDSPSDTHALEISTALAAGNLVIPVLVEGAEMPSSDELPASLVELSFRNAFEVGVGRRFTTDIAELASRVVEAEEVAAAEQRARERREAEEVVAAEQRARERREAEEVV